MVRFCRRRRKKSAIEPRLLPPSGLPVRSVLLKEARLFHQPEEERRFSIAQFAENVACLCLAVWLLPRAVAVWLSRNSEQKVASLLLSYQAVVIVA
jgi:hypothetical protein